MEVKINYIHCLRCGGILELPEPERFSISQIGNMPSCKECGKKHEVKIESEGVLKVVVTELGY